MSSRSNPITRARAARARFSDARSPAVPSQQSAQPPSSVVSTSTAGGASEESGNQAADGVSEDEAPDEDVMKTPAVFGAPPEVEKTPKDFKLDNLQPKLARGPGLLVMPAEENRQFKSLHGITNNLEPEEDEEADDEDDAQGKTQQAYKHDNKPLTITFNTFSTKTMMNTVSMLLGLNHDSSQRLSTLIESGSSEIHKAEPKASTTKKTRKQEKGSSKEFHRHLDYTKKPISDIYEISHEMTGRLIKDDDLGIAFRSSLKIFEKYGLRTFTMCSGTEAPILAMDLIREGLERHGHAFNYTHIASAEIEPFKQGYIELNFHPPRLFRDVTEFCNTKATTAYGSVVQVPGDCHIVIAGSACVDYSLLNKHPKEFGKKGESWSTMNGIIEYCKIHKPAMVILENIKGAPWPQICRHWHNYIGYDVKAVIVDTKDFYIPQTRQRGYMLAINRERAQQAEFDTTIALESWAKYFSSFQHRASVPYTDVVFDSDSINDERTREQICSLSEPPNRNQPWTACAHRYKDLRSRSEVGDHRPYTQWMENGSSTPKDYTWIEWIKNQRDRVQDTLDIGYLRYLLRRDYDMAYKSRTIDLSQNIDRDLDSKHWGIVGCLTAGGLLYDTYRGGVISGTEALMLQGIPVDDLILDKLNMRQMYDLAGNAMTTTVVGSAIVAAIAAGTQRDRSIFFKPSIGNRHSPMPTLSGRVMSPETCENLWSSSGLEMREISLSTNLEECTTKQYLDEFSTKARRSRQLCACEGVTLLKDVKFLICVDCGHTVCTDCSGNPQHKYCELEIGKSDRAKPEEFMFHVTSKLPRALHFHMSGVGLTSMREEVSLAPTKVFGEKDSIDHGFGTWAQHLELGSRRDKAKKTDKGLDDYFVYQLNEKFRFCIDAAFANPFHFRGVKRGTAWTVEFSSKTARLELCFHQDNDEFISALGKKTFADCGRIRCYWLLYAICEADVPLGDMLREQLQHAVARMRPKKGLFDGEWQLIQPQNNSLIATVSGSEPFAALQARVGIQAPGYADIKLYRHLAISFRANNNGVEIPKPIEFEYLEDCGSASSLLYRSLGLTHNGMHSYLFLDPYHLQDHVYDCMVIAEDHSRLARNQTRSIFVKFASGWQPVIAEDWQTYQWQVVCESIDHGLPLIGTALGPNDAELCLPMWSPTSVPSFPGSVPCEYASMLAFAVAIPQYPELVSSFGDHGGGLRDMCMRLDLRDPRGHLKHLAWVLHALPVPLHLRTEIPVPTQLVQDICDGCSPPVSRPEWQWSRRRQKKSLALIPFEADEKAAEREQAMKSRPDIAFAWLNFSAGFVHISFHFNIKSLIHRTVAPLLRLSSDSNNLKVSWNVVQYDINQLPTGYAVPQLLDNSHDLPRLQPACFKRVLWNSQARTFSWMLKIEGGAKWEEKNIKDCAIKHLARKIIASAKREIKVCGGILADDVGTGKTTVAYSVIGDDIDKNRQPAVESTRIAIRATVILVPSNLVNQWCEQANRCFANPDSISVLRIQDAAELKTRTIQEMQDAHIIIVAYSIFDNRSFWDDLRSLCCLPSVPIASGRALMQWLEDADESLNELCEASALFTDPYELNKKRDELWKRQKNIRDRPFRPFQTHDTNAKGNALKAPVDKLKPGNATVQSSYPGAYEVRKEYAVTKPTPNLPTSTKHATVIPFLQLFSVRRLIIDEFQYLTPRMAAAAIHMRAEARWLLSGTPPIDTLDNVDQMARLIGIRITSRPNELVIKGFSDNKPKPTLREKTYVEEFEEYNDVVSAESVNLQHDLAWKFLERFGRMNAATTSHLKLEDRLITVTPSPVELVVFYEFFNVLSNQGIKYAKKKMAEETLSGALIKSVHPRTKHSNRTRAIMRLLGNSSRAEEALICCYRAAIQSFAAFNAFDITIMTIFNELAKDVISEGKYLKARAEQAVHYWLKTTPAERAKEKGDFKNWCSEVLRQHCLADLDVALTCDHILGAAHERRTQIPIDQKEMVYNLKKDGKSQALKYNDDTRATRNKENTARTSDLREASERLLVSVRAFRFMESLRCIQDLKMVKCMDCERVSRNNYDEFRVVLACGHIVCTECLLSAQAIDSMCPAFGCGVLLHTHNVLDINQFLPGIAGPSGSPGTRPKKIAELLSSIICADKSTDCAVVFLQYYPQVLELRAGLDAADLKYTDACVPPTGGQLRRAEKACAAIELFKNLNMLANRKSGDSLAFSADLPDTFTAKAAEVRQRSRVLLLMIDSEDAAGWNLQVCSHVVFAAPYVSTSAFRYDAVVKQATGRAQRVGQKKLVTRYQVAMCYTNEIVLLEEREKGKKLKKVGGVVRWVDEGAPGESVAGPPLVHKEEVEEDDEDEDEEGAGREA